MGHSLDSDRFYPARGLDQFLWKLLVCFLFADALERSVELVVQLQGLWRLEAGSPYAPWWPVSAFWVLTDVLLGTLLALRTDAGRLWTIAVFIIHLAFAGHMMAIKHPELWVYMSPLERVRVGFTGVVDVAAVAWLLTARARRFFDR